MKQITEVKGNLVDIENKRIYPSQIVINDNKIESIIEIDEKLDNYIISPLVDAHIHIESSMLTPVEFSRMASMHGTIATVSDPHEIANVNGVEGIKFMIENAKHTPLKIYFGAPSCVPATTFETAGAVVSPDDIKELFEKSDLKYLSEVMNFPGVINNDPDMMEKIKIAKEMGKQIDGHAPGLRGEGLKKYVSHMITTDHECFTKEEALEKLSLGMKIIIREGSGAKNFEALCEIMDENYENCMFCSDDKHPDSLLLGHINQLVSRAIKDKGLSIFKALTIASKNPIEHYKLDVGQLKAGDLADIVVVEDIIDFKVIQTIINGKLVAQNGQSFIESREIIPINNFNISQIQPEKIKFEVDQSKKYNVIEALDSQLITNKIIISASDFKSKDILKIVVVNRYKISKPSIGFIKNFGLKSGAIASSVAHDSHNIIAVGVDDDSIISVINSLIDSKGGMSATDGVEKNMLIPLEVGGLMTNEDCYKISNDYSAIDTFAKELGSSLTAPFMTLSFMALLVIPSIKLSDKGLFDGESFQFIDLEVK